MAEMVPKMKVYLIVQYIFVLQVLLSSPTELHLHNYIDVSVYVHSSYGTVLYCLGINFFQAIFLTWDHQNFFLVSSFSAWPSIFIGPAMILDIII